jgi:hypothetical protein
MDEMIRVNLGTLQCLRVTFHGAVTKEFYTLILVTDGIVPSLPPDYVLDENGVWSATFLMS